MTSTMILKRPIWSNRFTTPTIEDLLAAVTPSFVQGMNDMRGHLLETRRVTESLAWQGVSWGWTLSYVWGKSSNRPWAHLIPDPERPRLCLPLDLKTLDQIPMRKLSKQVRESIVHAPEVDRIRWAEWNLGSISFERDFVPLCRAVLETRKA